MQRSRWLAVLLVVLLPACATTGLSFVQDDRVRIVTPESDAIVRLPFTASWDVANFDGSYGVFIDRAPTKPGQPLESLVSEGDTACRTDPACPDEEWFADRNVYVTTGTELVVERLPDLRTNERSADRHELTIVLLDEDGRRIGESAFVREFLVERDD